MQSPAPHYTVLARRFRPQTFEEVIGQQHVAQALKNAICGNRVAHAYLFTGARGVGKTSMARILAKALNCPNAVDGVPCNACEICNAISAGNDVDVMEIDGASNRGIDDIRTIRANVGVKSMRTKYKLYVIDEVHMLTREAFNALLKTLEEPPPNVKFVFCTTEPHKVPDTILSRCQRFDFAAIETQNIVHRLQQIAEAEGCDVEPEALELVARRAAGSMRDGQSLFDQLLAFGDDRIAAQDVHRMLGTAEDERLIAIVAALVGRDRAAALREFASALADGVQLNEFFDQMIHYFRDLMMLSAGADAVSLQSVAEGRRPELRRHAESFGLETTVAALQVLVEAKGRMFRSPVARPLAELALVRISLLEDLDSIAALLHGLKNGDGTAAPAGNAPKARHGSPAPRSTSPSNPPGPVAESPSRRPSSKEGIPASVPAGPVIAENSVKSAKTERGDNGATPPTELQAGNEDAILSQLVDLSDDASRVHLKAVSIAISGPNQVELLFSPNYHFSRQYCDRPEIRSRLEQDLARIAGKPVGVVIRCDDSHAVNKPASAPSEQKQQTPTPDLSQAESDPFLQDAVTIFAGTVKKVEPLG